MEFGVGWEMHMRVANQMMIKEKAHALYKQETKQCFTLEHFGGKRCESNQRVRKRRKIWLIWKLQKKLVRWGQRPQKRKAAMPDSYLSHDDLQMYYETQDIRASTADKTADVQLRLSKEKLEAAHSQERTSMAQMYTNLLMVDLSGLTDMQHGPSPTAPRRGDGRQWGASSAVVSGGRRRPEAEGSRPLDLYSTVKKIGCWNWKNNRL